MGGAGAVRDLVSEAPRRVSGLAIYGQKWPFWDLKVLQNRLFWPKNEIDPTWSPRPGEVPER